MSIGINGPSIRLGGRNYGGGANLFTKTEALNDAYWTKTDLTITSDAIAAPNGTTTADLLTSGVAGTEAHARTVTHDVLSRVTVSTFVQRGNTDWFSLHIAGSGAERLRGWFNLGTGAVGSATNAGTATGATVVIQNVGGGWYRCALSGTLNGIGSAGFYQSYCTSADAVLTRVSGATRYQWGLQYQLGSLGPYRPVA